MYVGNYYGKQNKLYIKANIKSFNDIYQINFKWLYYHFIVIIIIISCGSLVQSMVVYSVSLLLGIWGPSQSSDEKGRTFRSYSVCCISMPLNFANSTPKRRLHRSRERLIVKIKISSLVLITIN